MKSGFVWRIRRGGTSEIRMLDVEFVPLVKEEAKGVQTTIVLLLMQLKIFGRLKIRRHLHSILSLLSLMLSTPQSKIASKQDVEVKIVCFN